MSTFLQLFSECYAIAVLAIVLASVLDWTLGYDKVSNAIDKLGIIPYEVLFPVFLTSLLTTISFVINFISENQFFAMINITFGTLTLVYWVLLIVGSGMFKVLSSIRGTLRKKRGLDE